MKITINVPQMFATRLKKTLARLEICESEMEKVFTEAVVNEQWNDDPELWTAGHVYPDRITAARVASKFVRGDGEFGRSFNYRDGRRVVTELFVSKHAAIAITSKVGKPWRTLTLDDAKSVLGARWDGDGCDRISTTGF